MTGNARLLLLLSSAVALAGAQTNLKASPETSATAPEMKSVDFEVYGKVQGVFFRKYTQQQATKLGLKGWCMNTSGGTVKGVIEGDSNKINDMKQWLQQTGSPSSQIDNAVFTNERTISKPSFDSFKIKR